MRIWLVLLLLGAVLFIPVFYVQPRFDLNSVSAYYLGGFILVEVFIFAMERRQREIDARKVKVHEHHKRLMNVAYAILNARPVFRTDSDAGFDIVVAIRRERAQPDIRLADFGYYTEFLSHVETLKDTRLRDALRKLREQCDTAPQNDESLRTLEQVMEHLKKRTIELIERFEVRDEFGGTCRFEEILGA